MRIVGVLLAAGSGSRFGGDKLRHPIGDCPHPNPLPLAGEGGSAHARGPDVRAVPLGVVACRNLVDALPDTIAIVRPDDATLAALLNDAGARIVRCPDAALGMGHSIACAVDATRDADGWVIALADMPWVRASTIGVIVDALREGTSIVAPSCNGRRGNPVGFSSVHADALARLTGDRGARDLVVSAGAALRIVDVDDAGVLRDVDVGSDL